MLMKKHLLLALVCLFGITGVQTAKAESEIYAVMSGTKITLYFDNQMVSHGTDVITGWTADEGSYNLDASDFEGITSVELDETMKDTAPKSTYYWFAYMTDVEEIIHLDYLNTASVTSMSGMFAYCYSLTSLDLGTFYTGNVTNMNNMFQNCSSLTLLDLSGFNTEKVTDMNYMFQDCSSLTSLDLSGFNTEKVTNMNYMFANCSSLTTIYCDGYWSQNTGITQSAGMFSGCSSLVGGNGTAYTSSFVNKTYAHPDGGTAGDGYFTLPREIYAAIDGTKLTLYFDSKKTTRSGVITGWNAEEGSYNLDFSDFEGITSVELDETMKAAEPKSNYCWFAYMKEVEEIIHLDYLNTASVTSMSGMFAYCSSLTSLDLSGFNTDNVTNMYNMFADCSSLTSLDLSGFNTDNVTNMYDMFADCSSLTSLDLSGFNTEKVTDMSFMFSGCKKLTSLDLSGFNTEKVTDMRYMFFGCKSLKNLTLGSNFDTGKVEQMNSMFSGCNSLTSLDLSGFNTKNVADMCRMFSGCKSLKNLTLGSNFDTGKVEQMSYMFSDCKSLTSLDLSGFNTEKVTDMSSMFYYCSSLTSLDLSGFNTEKVTDMQNMFSGCKYLKNLTLGSNFDTGKVKQMNYMFSDCSSLTSLDLSGFNTANVTSMNSMFYGCISLTSIDLSGFNTKNVTSMSHMFYKCSSLSSLDLSKFNTAKVEYMYNMFFGCSALTELDLSGFDVTNVNDTERMFYGCSALATIYCEDNWSLLMTSLYDDDDMFSGCTALVGGKGSEYDENFVGITAARPDKATKAPGYFTSRKEIYAVLSGKTMTLYYDLDKASKSGVMKWTVDEGMRNVDDTDAEKIKTVVLDESMKDAMPSSTAYWFFSIQNIGSITNLEYLNTDLVTDMSYMFAQCTSLASLDLTGFNTANVTNMSHMFNSCGYLLHSLDLGNFNIEKVTDMSFMFSGCGNLQNIYCNDDWSLSTALAQSGNMFLNCLSLAGGKGTGYDENVVDKTYARPDNGEEGKGYFTAKEIYVVLSSDKKTMTIYYDGYKQDRGGVVENWSADKGSSVSIADGVRAGITSVVIDKSMAYARLGKLRSWFYGMSSLIDLQGIEYLNTSEVTDMSFLFLGCSSLASIDLSGFNTEKVTDMSFMFQNCSAFETLDLSSFNTANVTDMNNMFNNCSNLTDLYLDAENFNTAAVTNMKSMFARCSAFTSLDLSGFNTAAVTDMNSMFFGCQKLKSLDLSGFNTAAVTDMSKMFNGCSALEWVDITGFDITALTTTEQMFAGCTALKVVYCDGYWSESTALTSSADMFKGCTSLVGGNGTVYNGSLVDKTCARPDGGSGNEGYFTKKQKQIYATLSGNIMSLWYDDRIYFRSNLLTGWDEKNGSENVPTSILAAIQEVYIDESMKDALPSSTKSWFYDMPDLEYISYLSYLNTSNVTDMSQMFYHCGKLHWLYLHNFNTSNVTDMGYMFNGCSSLTDIDVSRFVTGNVTNMFGMFTDCSKLEKLDLTTFNIAKVTNMQEMFSGCAALKAIYCENDWNEVGTALTSTANMFAGCTSLVGGNETKFDAGTVDITYARLDGGAGDEGYFSVKPKEVYAALEDGTTMVIYYDNRKNFHDASFLDDWSPWLGSDNVSYDGLQVIKAAVIDESLLEAPLTDLYSWFASMGNLTGIEGLENLNTANVTNMNYMFYGCSSLTSLDLGSFTTGNVESMYVMFNGCTSLTSLDLSNFNTEKVNDMSYMFFDCSALTTIYCKHDWSLNVLADSYGMFSGCTSLVGGDGTGYNAIFTDAAYARPDGVGGKKGYFTLPTAKGLEELYIDDNNGNAEDNSNNGNSNSNNNGSNASDHAVKVFRNGQIFILRSGRTYTITGTLVN